MGNGGRSRQLHRLRRVRDGVPCREQHPDRRPRAGGARARHALAARRALLGRRLSRRAAEVPAGDVPAVRRRAVRAGLPDLREPSHRRRAERAGLQPLHRHALLRQRLPVQRPLLRLLQPAVAQAAAPAAESGRLGPRGRRDGEVHVLRAANQRRDDRRQGREARAEGRRHQAGLRAVVLGAGAGVRRSERSRERGVAAVAIAARQQAARGPRHAARRSPISSGRRRYERSLRAQAQRRSAAAAAGDVVALLSARRLPRQHRAAWASAPGPTRCTTASA